MTTDTAAPDTAIALFVKTPGLSPLKTRLAATIGTEQALRLYRLSLRAVDDAIDAACGRDPNLRPYYAVAEATAIDHPRWRRRPCLIQGEGGLGQRLAYVHGRLAERHQQVMLIGADLPWLCASHLLEAVAALDASDMAIGPGLDGGYYLFASRIRIADEAYTSVEYSQPDTRAQFEAQLVRAGTLATLRALGDLDLQEDIPRLLADMPKYPTRMQRRLHRVMARHVP